MNRRLWSDIVAPAQTVLFDMHLRGIRVDQDARGRLLRKAHFELEQAKTDVLGVAQQHVGGAMPPTPVIPMCSIHADFTGLTPRNVRGSKRCEACVAIYEGMRDWRNSKAVKQARKLAEFNPGSKDQVAWLLYEALKLPVLDWTDTGKPRVTKGILEELVEHSKVSEDHVPLLRTLVQLAHVQHRISVDLDPPIGADGRFHPLYTLMGTAIMRDRSGTEDFDVDKGSDSSFNAMNVPDEVRMIYMVDPGQAFISADASQVEWALMMLLARCERGLQAYRDGRDIHTENAEEIVVPVLLEEDWASGTKDQRGEWRDVTKSFTHGGDYREGAFNLGRRFKVPKKRAQLALDRYFEKWPEILRWHQEIEETVIASRALRNPFGFQRRFLDVTSKMRGGQKVLVLDRKQAKEATAFGPASTNAAIWKINARRLYDAGIVQLTGTHDDHLITTREDQVEWTRRQVMELVTQPFEELADWNGGRPWASRFKTKVGRNWAPRHEHVAETCGTTPEVISSGGETWEKWECGREENLQGLH